MWCRLGRPVLEAVCFLTRLPVKLPDQGEQRSPGDSVPAYPLVGLLIGLVLVSVALMSAHTDSRVSAALVLLVWVVITGGLHLDGLADCADAWAGGLGDPDRTLEIMKDPAAGPAAVWVLILLLLLKYSALLPILETGAYPALLFVPVVGRCLVIPSMLSVPYLRTGGLGDPLVHSMPRRAAQVALVTGGVCSAYFIGITPVLAAVLVFLGIRHLCLLRLGGMTGDVYGAVIECAEAAVLVTAAVLLR